eukprot:45757-Karenia_brevis.AAC.1
MRCMLLANIDVQQHFANGTQGRAIFWSPSAVEKRKPLPATREDISIRFVKEASRTKPAITHGFDFIDVNPR